MFQTRVERELLNDLDGATSQSIRNALRDVLGGVGDNGEAGVHGVPDRWWR
jgi:hypothetical protein